MTIIINPEVKSDTGELFMTFKLLKRRYRSTESDDHLRRLDYFNQPFAPGSEIRLMDDIELDKPLALESLATQFEPVEEKRGKKNAIEREGQPKKKKDVINEMEPFDFNKVFN